MRPDKSVPAGAKQPTRKRQPIAAKQRGEVADIRSDSRVQGSRWAEFIISPELRPSESDSR